MDSNGNSVSDMMPDSEAACSSASGSNPTNQGNTDIENSQPRENNQRATDLLLSVSVTADINKQKIFDLASKAVQELAEMAGTGTNLWRYDDNDQETELLDENAYDQKFGPLDATLEEVISMILTGRPLTDLPMHNPAADIMGNIMHLKREVSRATGHVSRNPVHLVNMLMDAVQWSYVFPNIVSNATVLGVLSNGQPGNPDGALQVMRADFHLPSPLFPAREISFARHCRQLGPSTWVVVDISLETIFEQLLTRCQRRPSGCLIQGLGDGNSKISWVEHNFVDNNNVHSLFRRLVDSGLAFSAERWVATLEKQCDYLDATLRESQVPGNRNLLCLAHRMSRSFSAMINTSAGNNWRPMPTSNADNIFVRTSYNDDDLGTSRGIVVSVVTSIRLPVLAENIFEFIQCSCCHPQWDLLSSECKLETKACISTGREPTNLVSTVLVEHKQKKRIPICYLEDSYTDAIGHYMVYAPIDIPTINAITVGTGNLDAVAILASGFAVLPDEPNKVEEGNEEWSILSIMFQIIDQNASSDFLPPQSVASCYNLITSTANKIQARFASS